MFCYTLGLFVELCAHILSVSIYYTSYNLNVCIHYVYNFMYLHIHILTYALGARMLMYIVYHFYLHVNSLYILYGVHA